VRGRIRTIKPDIGKHEELWDLGQTTGLPVYQAFTLLWCYADREGRFEWRPRSLKTDILPYWDGDFSRVLDALTTRGFIVRYACGDREFGVIPTFSKHQVVNHRESPSELPAPNDSEQLTRDSRVQGAPGHAHGEWKGREGKGMGKEGNGMGLAREARDVVVSEPKPAQPEPPLQPWQAEANDNWWRPRSKAEANAAPIQQRAEWAIREVWAASEYQPQAWPEVVQVAEAFCLAYKLAPPKLGRLDQDRHGTRRIIELLTLYTPSQLVSVCKALPDSEWSKARVGERQRPRLGWLSDEVVRTTFGGLAAERPMDPKVRRILEESRTREATA
jgi:hypothetical protein